MFRTECPDDIHKLPHGQTKGIYLLRKNDNEIPPAPGGQRVFGLNDLTRARAEEDTKKASMEKAALKGFV